MQSEADQLHEVQDFDRARRTYNDTVTWCAEMLNGSMRTSFEYSFDGIDLYGEDSGSVTEIFDDAIKAAEVIVDVQPNLLFELRRRLVERGELEDMLDMMKGQKPNTMVVVSDYPPELMDCQIDVGGYNAARKQTMLRVVSKLPDGTLRLITQSLEGSNRQALETIYHSLGQKPEPGELLGQRLFLDLPPSWQDALPDNLTDVYDSSLKEQDGSSYHAGLKLQSKGTLVNTYDFAKDQDDLINWFSEAKLNSPYEAERLRVRLAATIFERFESYKKTGRAQLVYSDSLTGQLNPMQTQAHLMAEMAMAVNTATAQGRTFSGCGLSISMELGQTEGQLDLSGYGNKSNESTKYSFDKKMYCVVCQSQPKDRETKKMCGPCGICRNCDLKLRSS